MRHLSRQVPAWLILTCFLLLGGHVVAAAQTARVGREFKVKVGRVVTLDGGSLRLRFARVTEDSRCPVDVDCVWAGNAEVLLEVSARGGRGRKSLTLNTNAGGERASEGRYGRYTIRLVDLSPQPRSKRKLPAPQYTATLLVTKE
ncbi:MAG: hypothetical protein ABW208_10970 [Pyrinomonadaceae bacterium]